MMAGEARMEESKNNKSEEEQQTLLWDSFHQFSLTQATLYLQKYYLRLLRQRYISFIYLSVSDNDNCFFLLYASFCAFKLPTLAAL